MIYLGLDIGDVRIGVSKGQDFLKISTGYEVINRNNINPFVRINEIIKEENVNVLVVGLPKTKEGKHEIQCDKILNFIEELKSYISKDISIEFVDERYTTSEAEYYLKNFSKKNGKERRKIVDMVAATIILQNYLDKINKKR